MNKFKVGDRVTIIGEYSSGVIIENDHSGIAYNVQYDSGNRLWYLESELKLTEETPQGKHHSNKLQYAVLSFNEGAYKSFDTKEEVLEYLNSEEADHYEEYGVYELGKQLKLKETREVSFE